MTKMQQEIIELKGLVLQNARITAGVVNQLTMLCISPAEMDTSATNLGTKAPRLRTPDSGTKPKKCFRCQKHGHYAFACPDRLRPAKKKTRATATNVENLDTIGENVQTMRTTSSAEDVENLDTIGKNVQTMITSDVGVAMGHYQAGCTQYDSIRARQSMPDK